MRVAIAPSGGHEARDVPSRARPGSNDITEKVDTAKGIACNFPAPKRKMKIASILSAPEAKRCKRMMDGPNLNL